MKSNCPNCPTVPKCYVSFPEKVDGFPEKVDRRRAIFPLREIHKSGRFFPMGIVRVRGRRIW